MSADIETSSITFEIKADTKKFDDSIEKLTSCLESINKLCDSEKYSRIANGLHQVTFATARMQSAMAKINETKLASKKITSLLKSFNKFGDLDETAVKNMYKAGVGIDRFARGFMYLSNVDSIDVDRFGRSIKNISDGISKSAENINKLGEYGASLNKLGNAFNKMKKMDDVDFSNFIKNLNNLSASLKIIDDKEADKLYKLATACSSASKIKTLSNVKSKDERLQDKQIKETIQTSKQHINGLLHSLNVGVKSSVKSLKLLSKFGREAINVGRRLGDAFGGRFIRNIVDATKKVNHLGRSFARIASYRAINTVLRSITEGFTTGLQNAYMWADLTGDKFASTMNGIASSMEYARNSLGAMTAPLFNALAPVLDTLIDKFVALVNVINQLFAVIGGKGQWIKAIKYPKSYADSIGGVGKSAKDAKKDIDLFLASFDELNVMPAPKTGGSGGGGGGASGGVDYSDMFEVVDVSDSIKDLMSTTDWTELGKQIGNGLNIVTDSMDDWINNKFRPFLNDWTMRFATLLNGVMETYDFSKLGKLMADGLNAIIDGANTFMETFNYYRFGEAIGQVINSWFDNIEWNNISRYFSNKLDAIIQTAKGFVDELLPQAFGNGYKVGEAVKDVFDSINWNDIKKTLKGGIKVIADFFDGFFSGKDGSFKNFAKELSSTIKEVLSSPDTARLIEGAGRFVNEIVSALDDPSLWFTLGETVGKAIASIDWWQVFTVAVESIGSFFVRAFKEIFTSENGLVLSGLVVAIGGLSMAFDFAKNVMLQDAIQMFATNIGTAVATQTAMAFVGEGIVSTVTSGVGGFLSSITTAITTLLPSSWLIIGGAILAGVVALASGAVGKFVDTVREENEKTQADFDGMQERFHEQYGRPAMQNALLATETDYQTHLNEMAEKQKNALAIAERTSAASYDAMFNAVKEFGNKVKSQSEISYSELHDILQTVLVDSGQMTKEQFDYMYAVSSGDLLKMANAGELNMASLQSVITEYTSEASDDAIKCLELMSKTGVSALADLYAEGEPCISDISDVIRDSLETASQSGDEDIAEMAKNILDYVGDSDEKLDPIAKSINNKIMTLDRDENGNIKSFDALYNSFFTSTSKMQSQAAVMARNVNKELEKVNNIRVSPKFSPGGSYVGAPRYAEGGFPDEGQLFVAREAGAELVGNIGSRTAVVNNQQIVSAVSQGVARAVAGVVGGSTELVVNLDGDVVYRTVIDKNNNTYLVE